MRKSFEQSKETAALVDLLCGLRLEESVSFADASRRLGFTVASSTPAYQSAKRIAERDHGVYIGSVRGTGFFRGTGEDMAESLTPLSARINRAAKTSIGRADLALINNLQPDTHAKVLERRSRASIIFSTSGDLFPVSNRKRQAPALEADKPAKYPALRRVG